MRISKPWFHVQKIIYPSWHFNIAMEHGPLQDDLQHSGPLQDDLPIENGGVQ